VLECPWLQPSKLEPPDVARLGMALQLLALLIYASFGLMMPLLKHREHFVGLVISARPAARAQHAPAAGMGC
jgi:hypothetical protein